MPHTEGNKTSLIRFKDDDIRAKYKKIVESVLYGHTLIAVSAYLLSAHHVYSSGRAEDMPESIKKRIETLFREFPELENIKDPSELAEMFHTSTVNDILELAILMIEATRDSKVVYSNVQDMLLPLVFSSEGGITLTEEDLERVIESVETLGISDIADA